MNTHTAELYSSIDIERMKTVMRENAVKGKIIKTQKEAHRMTKNDPFGHVWNVGDEYYLLYGKEGLFNV